MTGYDHHRITDGLDVWMRPTPHEDIVTIMGFAAVPLWRDYSPLLLEAWADLLDKGTTKNDKIALAQVVESLGAHIGFSYSSGHLMWNAQCLKKDITVVYAIIQEMLFSSIFPEDEIRLWANLAVSSLHEEVSDPTAQSAIALSHSIYPSEHPLYKHHSLDDKKYLGALDIDDVRKTLQSVAWEAMHIVVVGDIDVTAHVQALASWSIKSSSASTKACPAVITSVSERKHIEIPDKTSSHVRIAQALTITKDDPDYWPLMVAVDALGGTFSARLMRTVRDVEGLTYGVNSHLVGLVSDLGGYFSVVITLAPVNVDKGIASTLFQIEKWHKEGMSEDECAARKEGLLGRHAVRATSTTQIASSMRHGLMHGFGAAYSEDYMNAIQGVTCVQANAAIKKWLDPQKFIIVSAGTSSST